MWGFAWMFWMVPLFVFVMFMRRRRWERWATMHGEYGQRRTGTGVQRDLEGQQSYIDSLETRIAQLEEQPGLYRAARVRAAG